MSGGYIVGYTMEETVYDVPWLGLRFGLGLRLSLFNSMMMRAIPIS